MSFSSCTKDDLSVVYNDYYENYDELPEADGLKLYPFISFTEEEMRVMSYAAKLERRQIPIEFLQGMSTKELFYQFVYTDLSRSMLMFNTSQQGFEAVVKQFNMLPELLSRSDVGTVLLDLLEKTNPSSLKGPDCLYWFYCLQIVTAQTEVINRMTNEEIDKYVFCQIRCYDSIRNLSAVSSDWEYPTDVKLLLFGLGNVMIRYEFVPFMQMLDRDMITNELIWDTQYIDEPDALLVIKYVEQFINVEK